MTTYDMVDLLERLIDLHRCGEEGPHEVFNFDIMGIPFAFVFQAEGTDTTDPMSKHSRWGNTRVQYISCIGGVDPDLPDGWRTQYGEDAISTNQFVPTDEAADLLNRSPSHFVRNTVGRCVNNDYPMFAPHLHEMSLDEYIEGFGGHTSGVHTFDFIGLEGELEMVPGERFSITVPDIYLRYNAHPDDYGGDVREMMKDRLYSLTKRAFKYVEKDPLRMRPLTFYR